MVESQYSKSPTVRDWSNPSRLPIQAMLDPASDNLYVPAKLDILPDDRLEDPDGNEWRITTPTASDVSLTSMNPIQVWANPYTGVVPGMVVHIERVTP